MAIGTAGVAPANRTSYCRRQTPVSTAVNAGGTVSETHGARVCASARTVVVRPLIDAVTGPTIEQGSERNSNVVASAGLPEWLPLSMACSGRVSAYCSRTDADWSAPIAISIRTSRDGKTSCAAADRSPATNESSASDAGDAKNCLNFTTGPESAPGSECGQLSLVPGRRRAVAHHERVVARVDPRHVVARQHD